MADKKKKVKLTKNDLELLRKHPKVTKEFALEIKEILIRYDKVFKELASK